MSKKKLDLKTETAKWYAKLKRDGFDDIESDEDNLKVWSTIFFKKHSIEQIQAKQAYYQMATNFLNDYKFNNNRERIIWEYHANGISLRDIGKVLKKAKIKKATNRTDVWKVVKRLKLIMYDMYMIPKKAYHE
jgi:hypothetical protein